MVHWAESDFSDEVDYLLPAETVGADDLLGHELAAKVVNTDRKYYIFSGSF